MKQTLLLAVLAAFLMANTPAHDEPSYTPAEAEVRKLEREWLDAYEKHDAAAMERIVGEGFTITFPDGSIQNRGALMKQISTPLKAGGPTYKFHTEKVESRAYGDVVILMGVVVTEYERDGKPVREESRYTDTYIRKDGRWQVVASHLSRVPEPRPEPGKE